MEEQQPFVEQSTEFPRCGNFFFISHDTFSCLWPEEGTEIDGHWAWCCPPISPFWVFLAISFDPSAALPLPRPSHPLGSSLPGRPFSLYNLDRLINGVEKKKFVSLLPLHPFAHSLFAFTFYIHVLHSRFAFTFHASPLPFFVPRFPHSYPSPFVPSPKTKKSDAKVLDLCTGSKKKKN